MHLRFSARRIQMTDTIVILGDMTKERVDMRSMALGLGFKTIQLPDVRRLKRMRMKSSICAVVAHCDALSEHKLDEFVHICKALGEDVRVILCQPYFPLEGVDNPWFYTLVLPLSETETRHALGFLWSVLKRRPNKKSIFKEKVAASSTANNLVCIPPRLNCRREPIPA